MSIHEPASIGCPSLHPQRSTVRLIQHHQGPLCWLQFPDHVPKTAVEIDGTGASPFRSCQYSAFVCWSHGIGLTANLEIVDLHLRTTLHFRSWCIPRGLQ